MIEHRQETKAEARVQVQTAQGGNIPQSDEVSAAENQESKASQAPMSVSSSRLDIDRDKETGNVVYTFTDRVTGEVVRQLPPEELIQQAQRLAANRKGLFIDESA